jgi:hypothetical protein
LIFLTRQEKQARPTLNRLTSFFVDSMFLVDLLTDGDAAILVMLVVDVVVQKDNYLL